MDFINQVKSKYEILAAKKELDNILLSHAAYKAVVQLDKGYEGTDNYMGMSWFWNHEYSSQLRPETCSVKKRVAVHDAFVTAKLDLKDASPEHEKIIKKIVG